MAKELNMSAFGKRLKEARTNKGLTQKDLSDISGVSTVMISAYESSNPATGKNPALTNIYSIAAALGVSIDWLCGSTKKPALQEKSIDTETFLWAVIEMLNQDKVKFFDDIDKFNSHGYSPSYSAVIIGEKIGAYGNCNISKFASDYLEVKSLTDKGLLPDGIKDTVIKSVVDKYKGLTINGLFMDDMPLEDDLPF